MGSWDEVAGGGCWRGHSGVPAQRLLDGPADTQLALLPGSRLIMSAEHPSIGLVTPGVDYFATHRRSEEPLADTPP